mgnify:CR=1 FL=1
MKLTVRELKRLIKEAVVSEMAKPQTVETAKLHKPIEIRGKKFDSFEITGHARGTYIDPLTRFLVIRTDDDDVIVLPPNKFDIV